MADFFYRTESIRPDEILDYFVETKNDRAIIGELKARNPAILIGSRGVGKSFLLRVAEAELLSELNTAKVFPVYVTFSKSSLIHTDDPSQFHHWMLARICSSIIRSLMKSGLITSVIPSSLSILSNEPAISIKIEKTKIEKIAEAFEASWQNPGASIDISGLPSIETFKYAIEDLCSDLKLNRFSIFIDEAAHIFWPEQQRQFFTLFRDLNSAYITCNAAVYPGVTAYGETFQPAHDATMLTLNRDILENDYISNMREIVKKQADSTIMSNIVRNGQNFALLAYSSSGNPRVLLKTLARAPKINGKEVNEVIREYYRTDIWSEHSSLAEKYPGHRKFIDWGRRFVEDVVLPDLQKKNDLYIKAEKKSTSFFWIHKDAPEVVKEALRLLAYTGIVTEHSTGIKATRSEIGNRYSINLGCLLALEATPTSTGFVIAKSLTPKRMSEYGINYPFYKELVDHIPTFAEPDMKGMLLTQLAKNIDVLDITAYQKEKLHLMDINSIGDMLRATETKFKEVPYIGDKRARRMRNAAIAAVLEYLSG